MDDQFDWQPPSEAEMKIIAARRERSDKISSIMGGYLLKGYKMLGVVCDQCSTILMETKAGDKYCIACRELDTDTDKDNPAINPTAARSQVEEGNQSATAMALVSSTCNPQTLSTTARSEIDHVDIPPTEEVPSDPVHSVRSTCIALEQSRDEGVDTLCGKIVWASSKLKTETDLSKCIQLCDLIKASADAIHSLKEM